MKIWRHLNLKENISRPILLTNCRLGIGWQGCGDAFGIVKLAKPIRAHADKDDNALQWGKVPAKAI